MVAGQHGAQLAIEHCFGGDGRAGLVTDDRRNDLNWRAAGRRNPIFLVGVLRNRGSGTELDSEVAFGIGEALRMGNGIANEFDHGRARRRRSILEQHAAREQDRRLGNCDWRERSVGSGGGLAGCTAAGWRPLAQRRPERRQRRENQ